MKRREFLLGGGTCLASVTLSKWAFAAPCPPPSFSASGGTSVNSACGSSTATNPVALGSMSVGGNYTTGLTGNNGSVSLYRVWYPAGLSSPAPVVVFCGGLGNMINQATEYTSNNAYVATDNYEFGYLFASHGFIAIFVEPPNTNGSGSYGRANALLAGATMLANENTRSGSPLFGLVQTNNMCAMGHSMGGGGAFMAGQSSSNTRFKCVIGLNPAPDAGITPNSLSVPMLFITGQGDSTANFAALYSAIPSGTPKLFAELKTSSQAGSMHDAPRAPIGSLWNWSGGTKSQRIWDNKISSLSVSFLQRYLNSNTAYTQFLTNDATVLSNFQIANIT